MEPDPERRLALAAESYAPPAARECVCRALLLTPCAVRLQPSLLALWSPRCVLPIARAPAKQFRVAVPPPPGLFVWLVRCTTRYTAWCDPRPPPHPSTLRRSSAASRVLCRGSSVRHRHTVRARRRHAPLSRRSSARGAHFHANILLRKTVSSRRRVSDCHILLFERLCQNRSAENVHQRAGRSAGAHRRGAVGRGLGSVNLGLGGKSALGLRSFREEVRTGCVSLVAQNTVFFPYTAVQWNTSS